MVDARDGVRIAIKDKGVRQEYVAKKAGMSGQKLSDIINKRRKLDANDMFAICDVLNITPNDLYYPKGRAS